MTQDIFQINDEKIKTLFNFNLITEADGILKDNFLLQKCTKRYFSTILIRLNNQKDQSEAAIRLKLNSLIEIGVLDVDEDGLTEKEFHKTALNLLGYEYGTDYTDENIDHIAESIGLLRYGKGTYTNNQLYYSFYELLRVNKRSGQNFLESAIDNGFLRDFNKDKKVPEILVFDGKTQPIFDYKKSIFEKVFVECPLDTDCDGKRDLIAVYIRRPIESTKGMKVPAIYISNPYMLGTNDDLYITHNVDKDLYISEETNIEYEDIKYHRKEEELPSPRKVNGKAELSLSEPVEFETTPDWYNYFLVRGYAIVYSGGIGTKGSDGIRTCGSEEETVSTISVIDWLNGRTKAFTNKTDNIEVVADWCTGNVGMTGISYVGTQAVAAAISGVEGLKTIVPESSISNWYEYYRCNGITAPAVDWQGDDADLLAEYCFSRRMDKEDYEGIKGFYSEFLEKMRKEEDRVTGNYNKFWDERNYCNNAHKINCSVCIVHGLNDWNVKSKQFDMLWTQLVKYNVPRKMILHQSDHDHIDNHIGFDYNHIMNKWFGHWLYGIDNGVMEEIPNVMIQNNVDTHIWDGSSAWPFENSKHTEIFVDGENKLSFTKSEEKRIQTFSDDLSLSGFDREKDNRKDWRDSLVKEPLNERKDRLAYVSPTLTKDIRISGTVGFSMKASLDKPTGIISAMLVDYGKEYRPTVEKKPIIPNGISFGGNGGTADIVDFVIDKKETDYKIITRGWMNVQNRRNNYNKDTVIPGKEYTFEFDMQPMDFTVKEGHRLGLIVYSTDADVTQRPFIVTNFKVDSSSIVVNIPVVNGLEEW